MLEFILVLRTLLPGLVDLHSIRKIRFLFAYLTAKYSEKISTYVTEGLEVEYDTCKKIYCQILEWDDLEGKV